MHRLGSQEKFLEPVGVQSIPREAEPFLSQPNSSFNGLLQLC